MFAFLSAQNTYTYLSVIFIIKVIANTIAILTIYKTNAIIIRRGGAVAREFVQTVRTNTVIIVLFTMTVVHMTYQ